MRKRQYYWRWFRRATSGRLGQAEQWTGILTVVAAVIALIWKPLETHMNIIPLVVFGAIFFGTVVFGFLTAPYWMHKELEQERQKLQSQIDGGNKGVARLERLERLKHVWNDRVMSGQVSNDVEFAQWKSEFMEWKQKANDNTQGAQPISYTPYKHHGYNDEQVSLLDEGHRIKQEIDKAILDLEAEL